jgi:hypothetical protein
MAGTLPCCSHATSPSHVLLCAMRRRRHAPAGSNENVFYKCLLLLCRWKHYIWDELIYTSIYIYIEQKKNETKPRRDLDPKRIAASRQLHNRTRGGARGRWARWPASNTTSTVLVVCKAKHNCTHCLVYMHMSPISTILLPASPAQKAAGQLFR